MLTQEFPSICRGIDLLRAMEAHPDFGAGTTPILTSTFLSRIEDSDPADPNLSEDDTGSSWGHYQFTSGSMRIKSVIQSWECVGSTATACKLIAAALKTCKVARHICFEQKINTTSFLADAYLSNLIDELYDVWVKAGGVLSLTTISATVLTIMVVKPTSTTGQTGPTVGVDVDREHDHPHMPPGPPPSPTVPPSSPPSSMFVDSLKDSSAYSVPSIGPLDAKTASSSGVAGTEMDVDLPVGRTVSGSKRATNNGMTGRGARGGGTIGTDTACGGTTDQGTIGKVITRTGEGSTTGDLLGTGLGHQGDLAGGSTTDTTQSSTAGIKRSTAGVKPQTGLHVSA
jgi:hypothetical protein